MAELNFNNPQQRPAPYFGPVQFFGSRTFVDPGLIAARLHNPHRNHQAETSYTVQEQPKWGNLGSSVPAHIAKTLTKLQPQ